MNDIFVGYLYIIREGVCKGITCISVMVYQWKEKYFVKKFQMLTHVRRESCVSLDRSGEENRDNLYMKPKSAELKLPH